ncbi:VOC family protein [Autumnicola musiva]|uniref:VOC family protein n=1 Tax=Autumnicola musiva TaxID=3075589 RepID=A0ABU3D6Y0_9FLAO|nr:VOC family protein [Zunongwangia sp. F117]MDT0677273.1 VOC family protein [Zunongwangia sp. F117]
MFLKEKIFSGFSVDDLVKASNFYVNILGLEIEENAMGILELKIKGSNSIILYPKPDHDPATFTVLNIPVDNIDKAVDELTQNGVRFEQYDGELKTDDKGIFRDTKNQMGIAWFRDPAGNILSILETQKL